MASDVSMVQAELVAGTTHQVVWIPLALKIRAGERVQAKGHGEWTVLHVYPLTQQKMETSTDWRRV